MIHPQLKRKMEANRAMGFDYLLPVIVFWRAETFGILAGVDMIRRGEKWTAYHAPADAIREFDLGGHDVYLDKRIQLKPMKVGAELADAIPLIGADKVWEKGVDGTGVKLAVVDTGLDFKHPDLSSTWINWQNFVPGKKDAQDEHGHGSHCAGIALGRGKKYRGIAPGASLLVARVLDENGSGSESDVMAGVEWAEKQGAQVISLSLGSDGSCDGTDALSLVCDAAVDKGVVVCVAAGNAGPGRSTVGSPGCARKVISVGATDKSDRIADFSSRGPTSDGRTVPTICAPGVNIISCRAAGTSMGSPIDQYYTMASGTSMATPCAAGVVALLLQANPKLTPGDVKAIFAATAKNIGADKNIYGAGRVDAYAAYLAAKEQQSAPVTGISVNPTNLSMSVGSHKPIKATLEPKDAEPKAVLWGVRGDDAVSVDDEYLWDTCMVTAVEPGRVEITAHAGNVTAMCVVSVKKKGAWERFLDWFREMWGIA